MSTKSMNWRLQDFHEQLKYIYSRLQNYSSTCDNSCYENSYPKQFCERHFCRVMMFGLYTVYKKHGYDENWQLNQEKVQVPSQVLE